MKAKAWDVWSKTLAILPPRIPMKGDIDSLNASVAAGVLAYEIVRQRMQ